VLLEAQEAAFDTADHDLLLQRLERQFRLCGTVFQWIQSYLSGRTFRVVYGDVLSFIVYVMASSADQLERCVLDIGQWMSANRLKLNADKTERLFAGSGHCCAALKGSYPVLKLDADTAVASSHVRLLGLDISLDLSVDRHVPCVCAGCFYRLRQLRRIRRSLDSDSLPRSSMPLLTLELL